MSWNENTIPGHKMSLAIAVKGHKYQRSKLAGAFRGSSVACNTYGPSSQAGRCNALLAPAGEATETWPRVLEDSRTKGQLQRVLTSHVWQDRPSGLWHPLRSHISLGAQNPVIPSPPGLSWTRSEGYTRQSIRYLLSWMEMEPRLSLSRESN